MYDKIDGAVLSSEDLSSCAKTEKGESKDEPWTRLNELDTFSLCGFGRFPAALALGMYNKERKDTLQRQGLTERDRLWDQGVRVPVGARIEHASATPQWGPLDSEGVPGDALLIGDFILWSQEAYDKYQPDVKKNEARRKKALSIDKFAKAGKQQTMMFGLLHGKEHCEEILACLAEF